MKKIIALVVMMLVSFSAWSMQVNINQASAEDIATSLSGIGLTKAQEIVRYREQHGEFKSLEDLEKVRGIGSKLLERNADKIILNAKQ